MQKQPVPASAALQLRTEDIPQMPTPAQTKLLLDGPDQAADAASQAADARKPAAASESVATSSPSIRNSQNTDRSDLHTPQKDASQTEEQADRPDPSTPSRHIAPVSHTGANCSDASSETEEDGVVLVSHATARTHHRPAQPHAPTPDSPDTQLVTATTVSIPASAHTSGSHTRHNEPGQPPTADTHALAASTELLAEIRTAAAIAMIIDRELAAQGSSEVQRALQVGHVTNVLQMLQQHHQHNDTLR